MNYVTFDIETYNPINPNKFDIKEFRVSVIGAYFSWLDEYIAFTENYINDFLETLEYADLVVGFNHIYFDLAVLQKYSNFDLNELANYDLMLEFEKVANFKVKLNDLCKANFGDDLKTDIYDKYKNYYQEKKWLELIDYCMNDVRLTQKLFEMALNEEKISYYDLHILKEVILKKPNLNDYQKSKNYIQSSQISIF